MDGLDWVNLGLGIVGVLAGAGGLVFAYLARRAAKSAETASIEARQAVTRTITLVDVQRAIDFIQRIKSLHHEQRWDAARELYQPLRENLNDIEAATHIASSDIREAIRNSVPVMTDLENVVSRHTGLAETLNVTAYNESLNSLQQYLEALRSSMIYEDDEADK